MTLGRLLNVAQLFARQIPNRVARPSRRAAGSRSGKKPHHTRTLSRDQSKGAICEPNVFLQFEPARRSLLSLRDPTGAAHAVGPPEV